MNTMYGFKQYLLSLLSAAIICAILNKFSFKAESINSLIRLMSTVFLLITAFSPFVNIGTVSWLEFPVNIQDDAKSIISDVQVSVTDERIKYISDKVGAYIVDRAATYGASVMVRVNITDREKMLPDTVIISGNISPYGKNALKNMIETELGIPEEKQIWK